MSSYQKANSKRGIKVQDAVDEHNEWLKVHGRLMMFRVPEDIKVTGFNGAVKSGFAAGHAYLDFAGMIPELGGRFVGLEVKSVSESSTVDNCPITRHFPFSKLNKKQIASAKSTIRFGGIVAIFVRRIQRSGHITDYLIPLDADGNIGGVTKKKNISWEEAERFRILPGQVWLDTLNALLDEGFIS